MNIYTSNNNLTNNYTTYPCDCSVDNNGACIDIQPNNIQIQIYQPVANPVLSDIIEDIENLQQNYTNVNSDINQLYVNDEALSQANQNLNSKVDDLAEEFSRINDFVNREELEDALTPYATKTYVDESLENIDLAQYATKVYVDEEIAKIDVSDQLQDYAKISYVDEEIAKIDFVDETELQSAISTAVEPLASKVYVQEEISKVDVSDQLQDYAKIDYVDSEIAKIDISDQLENYVDKPVFEDSEMATAQLFALINEDVFYKADKSEFQYYSTLEYVDTKDNAIYTYIDNQDEKLLKISDYEKNTEETNFALAQTIAVLNSSLNNMDSLLVDYYTKSEVDTMMEAATGVDFSQYATKTYVDEQIASVDFVDETELQNTLSTYATTSYVDEELTSKISVWTGTQAEYDALTEIDDEILYLIKENE